MVSEASQPGHFRRAVGVSRLATGFRCWRRNVLPLTLTLSPASDSNRIGRSTAGETGLLFGRSGIIETDRYREHQ